MVKDVEKTNWLLAWYNDGYTSFLYCIFPSLPTLWGQGQSSSFESEDVGLTTLRRLKRSIFCRMEYSRQQDDALRRIVGYISPNAQ